MTTPKPHRIDVKDERRIVIHTVCRDLLKVLSRRQKLPMGKIVWNALAEHWINCGYDSRLMFHIMDPPCPTCGHTINNPQEKDREQLVERLSGDGWKEYEKEFIAQQDEYERLANEYDLEHPNDKKRA